MLHPWITSRSSDLNPFRVGIAAINLSLPYSIHRSLGKFAKAEKIRNRRAPSVETLQTNETCERGHIRYRIAINSDTIQFY